MSYSVIQLKHLLRVALLALPVLLLLGLNGRTVTLLRPAADAPATGNRVSAPLRATVIKQRVLLEAASPLGHYVVPLALGWLPATLPASWLPRLVRRALVAAARVPGSFVAQLCRQRLLGAALSPQAP